MTKTITYLLVSLLALTMLYGCCTSQKTAERRISRMVECNPQLAKSDSVEVRDTVYIEKIAFAKDTAFLHDTLVIEKEGARVKILRRDTFKQEIPVYVEVECPSDTIYLSKKVPCPDKISVTKKDKNWIYLIIVGAVIVVLYLFRSRPI